MVGGRWPVQPHQRGQPGCGRRRAAVNADQDAGRGRAAQGGVLHAVPPQEEQTGAARRPRRLQRPHKPGRDQMHVAIDGFFFHTRVSAVKPCLSLERLLPVSAGPLQGRTRADMQMIHFPGGWEGSAQHGPLARLYCAALFGAKGPTCHNKRRITWKGQALSPLSVQASQSLIL